MPGARGLRRAADSGQRLVRSSGRLGGDPVRTPNGLRSPPWLPSVRPLAETEPEARRHTAARGMGDRVGAVVDTAKRCARSNSGGCTADPGHRRRWPPNAVDHRRPALRPRIGRAPGWTSRPPQRRLTSAPHGWPEEVSAKTQMIRRRMQGRVSFALPGPDPPRMRLRSVTTESAIEPKIRPAYYWRSRRWSRI